jgi:hypothetical protein
MRPQESNPKRAAHYRANAKRLRKMAEKEQHEGFSYQLRQVITSGSLKALSAVSS